MKSDLITVSVVDFHPAQLKLLLRRIIDIAQYLSTRISDSLVLQNRYLQAIIEIDMCFSLASKSFARDLYWLPFALQISWFVGTIMCSDVSFINQYAPTNNDLEYSLWSLYALAGGHRMLFLLGRYCFRSEFYSMKNSRLITISQRI